MYTCVNLFAAERVYRRCPAARLRHHSEGSFAVSHAVGAVIPVPTHARQFTTVWAGAAGEYMALLVAL
jgi:hypothetical protein